MACHHTAVTRFVAGAGAFVISLDSMVNIAFPAMAIWFRLPPEAMRWVIVCYVFTYAIMSFVGGTLADRLGHARVFRTGLALSALAYALGAAAPVFGWFLAGRVFQGFAAGLVYGTAPALATLAVSPTGRGRALGFLNAAIGVASATGPVLAGALVRSLGWQAVFATRIPVALAVLAWSWIGLPAAAGSALRSRVDVHTLLRASVLRECVLAFVGQGAIFAIWLLAPFYLVSLRGLDAFAGGLMFMLTPLGTALGALVAGRVSDIRGGAFGTRLAVIVGLGVEAAGLVAMGAAGRDTPLLFVACALFAAGFGLGLFQVPNMTTVMNAFPAGQQGAAGGLAFLARTLGVVAGVTALSAVFAWRRGAAGVESAFATGFVVAAAAVALATVAAFATHRKRAS
jgi:MFS family permease